MKEMLGSGNTVYLTRSCPRSVHISALLFSTNFVSSETSDILKHWATYIFFSYILLARFVITEYLFFSNKGKILLFYILRGGVAKLRDEGLFNKTAANFGGCF
jgi:hypothetical protein